MAVAMALVIVGGFTLQLAMGRSSFAVPAAYHPACRGLHGAGSASTWPVRHRAARGQWRLHAGFGRIAYLWVALMLAFGSVLMVAVARRTRSGHSLSSSEFLWSNMMLLWCFGGLAFCLRRQRHTGLAPAAGKLCAMAILTSTGAGPILPLPCDDPACLDDHHAGDDGVSR